MKVTGIIMVVIAIMAFMGWATSFAQGKSDAESPGFYIFLLLILAGGILLINKSAKK